MLVDGFDSPPAVMMPYNPPYYPALLEAAGFAKAKDLVAYYVGRNEFQPERMERLSEHVERRESETGTDAVRLQRERASGLRERRRAQRQPLRPRRRRVGPAALHRRVALHRHGA